MIVAELAKAGMHVAVDPDQLRPTQGFWRTHWQADCMPWDGFVRYCRSGEWITLSIASWATMTDCLRGFTFTMDLGQIELHATHEKPQRLAGISQ